MNHLTEINELKVTADKYIKEENFEVAIHLLKTALIANLNDFEILNKLGLLNFSKGYLEEAKFYYSKAFEDANIEQSNEIYRKILSIETLLQLQADTLSSWSHLFLDYLIRHLYECSFANHILNIDIDWFNTNRIGISDIVIVNALTEIKQILNSIDGLTNLYNLLDDKYSRQLLINIIAYRILGNKKVKLPLNNLDYWKRRCFIHKMSATNDTIKNHSHNWDLKLYELNKIGYNIRLYYISAGISNTFMEKQYEYTNSDTLIKVNEGDVVIDAGGCWGDTALYFSHEVGEYGHIYTFEFIPSNLEIMRKNIDLNPYLKNRITIIERPVWEYSNKQCYYLDNGPASLMSDNKIHGGTGEILTFSIDDLVIENKIHKVDFIKMDIEGAELKALKGSIKTIKKFKPTLAIAVYHHAQDFGNISQFISELNVGYQFFLGHYTINREETVLFATTN